MKDELAKKLIKQIKMQNQVLMRIADIMIAKEDPTRYKLSMEKNWKTIEAEIDAKDKTEKPQKPKEEPKETDEIDWSINESNVGVNK